MLASWFGFVLGIRYSEVRAGLLGCDYLVLVPYCGTGHRIAWCGVGGIMVAKRCVCVHLWVDQRDVDMLDDG